jgi:hypothetical protein
MLLRGILQLLTSYLDMNCLGTATGSKEDADSRPINFAIVIPGFYRSGYPQAEDYKYLKSLGLKTIL